MNKDDQSGGPFLKAMASRRKLLRVHPELMTRASCLDETKNFPLLVEPNICDLKLSGWVQNKREWLAQSLAQYGAILLRGFEVNTAEDFEQVAAATGLPLIAYDEPSTRRTAVGDNIYTSTEYPDALTIPLHNELSYSANWPLKLFFFCLQPAAMGGETPIADSRKVYQLLDAELREKFIRKQVMYVRNYGGGMGLSWQAVFRTDDRNEVETYCCANNIDFEWRAKDDLRTRQVRPAVARHPQSGELVWFNQAHVHHISSLTETLRRTLLEISGDDDAPLDINAFYGDGSAIEPDALDAVREAYSSATVAVAWQRGDVLMLDNMLAAHGRQPFTAPRKILVAMAEPVSG